MALVPGLNIGVGILVLIIIWIITMLAVIALAAVPKARYGIPAVLLLSVVVTIVLLFYPRQSADEAMMDTIQEDVDEVFYGRLVLLLTLSLFLAGGGVALFFIQCTETIHAKEKRTFYITS